MTELGGTGLIADDLYLLAHNDVSGKAYVQPRALGRGLAGGLLCELVLAGAVSVRHDDIAVMGRPPLDGLLVRVRSQVAAEPQAYPVREWLAYLARTAPANVAARLAASGYLAQDKGLLHWRGGRWVPTNGDSAFSPVLRVRAALDASRPLTIHDAVLAGLADACGLWFRLAPYLPARAARPVHHAVAQLAPGLQDLIAHTRAAVDSAVLTHRLQQAHPHQPPGVPCCPARTTTTCRCTTDTPWDRSDRSARSPPRSAPATAWCTPACLPKAPRSTRPAQQTSPP